MQTIREPLTPVLLTLVAFARPPGHIVIVALLATPVELLRLVTIVLVQRLAVLGLRALVRQLIG
jgi:hypothetical protein